VTPPPGRRVRGALPPALSGMGDETGHRIKDEDAADCRDADDGVMLSGVSAAAAATATGSY